MVFSSKRKTGESDTVGSESEPKRAKMMGPEELKQFTDSIIQQFKVSQDASNEALKKDLIQKMDTQASLMGAITTKIESISKNQEEAAVQAKADKEANDARFKSLEDRLSALENGSSSSIASDDGWKAALSKDVFEHDHGVVVHGFRLQGTDPQSRISAASRFLIQELKASTELLNKIIYEWLV